MAKIQGLMDLGKRGMAISQTAIQTSAHNIANRSTEGYTRQRVETATSPAIDEGKYRLGTGARISAINRVNNPWLEKQIEREGSEHAFLQGQSEALSRLEGALNEQTVKGLNSAIGDFFGSFRELANNPESAVPRAQVRDSAMGLINNFKTVQRQLDAVNGDMNKTIQINVEDVTGLAKEISHLNGRIQELEISDNGPANDERDRRDLLIKKLSEKVDITYAEDPKSGMINVNAGDTAILVAGTSYSGMKTFTDKTGQMQIYTENTPGGAVFNVTEQFQRGAVGGALSLREGHLADLSNQLNNLAYNIAEKVNEVHREGYDRYNQTGIDFFNIPQDGSFSIDSLKLSDTIRNDIGKIAAASKMDAPGDNTVANVIQELQHRPLMEGGKYSFDDFYNSKVGEFGLLSQRATSALESQKNSLDQLKNFRESISGVSLDEEASKMIEYQKSYEASARMIKVADEMFDTILNLKR